MTSVQKNFKKENVNLTERKQHTLSLLQEMNLVRVSQSVKKAPKLHLEMFCTAKTHKTDIPFRVVVFDRADWQIHVSTYLEDCLSSLKRAQLFLIKNLKPLKNI
ncbi:hypothetical protein HPB48_027008 [Haemaphysalis longicornis]|uniref:Uncharacterized protein n=1 Tax=Haemaphysalis longicornis TaxID=44386 RepID=A0A9J6HC89_HAELO|nr:hypothetical protein HPB48_027008 [Haemaphysalis longicornis]